MRRKNNSDYVRSMRDIEMDVTISSQSVITMYISINIHRKFKLKNLVRYNFLPTYYYTSIAKLEVKLFKI